MAALIMDKFRPNAEAMRQHVEHLFGGYLDGFHDGLVELAWTDSAPDASGRYRLKNGELFGTDALDRLVDRAVELNSTPMCNVYIGAWLRKPDTPPVGRCADEDALCATALYADLDDAQASAMAKEKWGNVKPTLIVSTGRDPYVRAQVWWKLFEPLTDHAEVTAALRGIALKLGADISIVNPGRVMRLAGSIAWPVKTGRKTEVTEIVPLVVPGQRCYLPEHIRSKFPAVYTAPDVAVDPGDDIVRQANSLGLQTRTIADGREKYMRNTILACLLEYVGENGCAPSGQELFNIVWPQYERHVDLSRPGRGREEVAEKCAYTASRFERGEIRGMPTLDAAVEVAKQRKEARDAVNDPRTFQDRIADAVRKFEAAEFGGNEEAKKRGTLAYVDFRTLLTEEVEEEPDYVEPGFAGPGNFVLIAGPPKAQKSFLLQELLVSCATGGTFLTGLFTVPRPLRVFYLQAEMNRKLLRKRARAMGWMSPEQKDLLQRNLIVSERFHMILNEGGVACAVQTIKEAFPDEPPDIIAIDPLANVFDKENENDNAQIMQFLTGRVEMVRQVVNPLAAIVMVHHATKRSIEDMDRDPFSAIRGGGALRGYYDSAIVIYKASAEGAQRKVHFELRSGESPDAMSVELVNGRFVKHDPMAPINMDTANRMLATIREAWASGNPMSHKGQTREDGRYAPELLASQFGIPEYACAAWLSATMQSGLVAYEMVSAKTRKHGLCVKSSIGGR